MGSALSSVPGMPKIPEVVPDPEQLLEIAKKVEETLVSYRDSYLQEWNNSYNAGERDAAKLNENARKIADKKVDLDKKIDELCDKQDELKGFLTEKLNKALGDNASNIPDGLKKKAVDKAVKVAFSQAVSEGLLEESKRLLKKKNGIPGDDIDIEAAGASGNISSNIGNGSSSSASAGSGLSNTANAAATATATTVAKPKEAAITFDESEIIMRKVKHCDGITALMSDKSLIPQSKIDEFKSKCLNQLITDFPQWTPQNINADKFIAHVNAVVNIAKSYDDGSNTSTIFSESEVNNLGLLELKGSIAEITLNTFREFVISKQIINHVANVVSILQQQQYQSSLNASPQTLKTSLYIITINNYNSLVAAAC